MKRLWILVLVFALMLPSAAFAQTEEQEVAVNGGALKFTQTRLNFTDITLSSKVLQSKAVSEVRAMDDRGNGGGWNYSVAATDFVTSLNGEEYTLPASIVKFTATLKNTLSGVPLDFSQGGEIATDRILSNNAGTVVSAEVGKGQGAYDFEVGYTVTLPKTMKNNKGKEIGVIAGTYRATFTYTATSGI